MINVSFRRRLVSFRWRWFIAYSFVWFAAAVSNIRPTCGQGSSSRSDLPSANRSINENLLKSIGLQTSYLSPDRRRLDACLNSVAFSPAAASNVSIGLAVGEAGTILRSEDLGETWHMVSAGLDIPFSDVRWLSRDVAIIVGGGFEPITGIGHGICLLSPDQGQTWQIAENSQTPILTSLQIGSSRESVSGLRRGVIRATGLADSARRQSTYESFDSGWTWYQSNNASRPDVSKPASIATITTPDGPVIVHRQVNLPADRTSAVTTKHGTQSVAVGPHGTIWKRTSTDTWRSVRGRSASTGVLFVSNSAATMPWGLIARETMQAGVRAAIVLEARQATDPIRSDGEIAKWRQTAGMLGAGSVHDAKTHSDQTITSNSPSSTPTDWLIRHRPAVLVLDETMPADRLRDWQAAAQAHGSHQPERVLTSSTESPSTHSDHRCEIFRGDQMLPRLAVSLQDIRTDALIMLQPQSVSEHAIKLRTKWDRIGTPGSANSVTDLMNLQPQQVRAPDTLSPTSHRRLQFATARIQHCLKLKHTINETAFNDTDTRLGLQLDGLLSMTPTPDRDRLAWSTINHWVHTCLKYDGRPVEDAERSIAASKRRELFRSLLQATEKSAVNPAVRRWAQLWLQVTTQPGDGGEKSVAIATASSSNQALSPFQNAGNPNRAAFQNSAVQQASHVQGVTAQNVTSDRSIPVEFDFDQVNRAPPPTILVPQVKPTVWQPSRGPTETLRQAMAFSNAMNKPSQRSPDQREIPEAWQTHPVVLALQNRISRQSSVHSHSNSHDITWQPSVTSFRPWLDGVLDEPCWLATDASQNRGNSIHVCRDDSYLYIAIEEESSERNATTTSKRRRLSLDVHNDYLNAWHFDFANNEAGTAAPIGITAGLLDPIPISAAQSPRWYVAHRQGTFEIAIELADLPAFPHRISFSNPGAESITTPTWQPLPNPRNWLSNQ